MFEAISWLYDLVMGFVLLCAVGLTSFGFWSAFRWWDDWRFREKAPPSQEGKFIAGKDEEE